MTTKLDEVISSVILPEGKIGSRRPTSFGYIGDDDE
jgi:hypothetical protein